MHCVYLKCEVGVRAHSFNPSTWEAEAGPSPEFKDSQGYKSHIEKESCNETYNFVQIVYIITYGLKYNIFIRLYIF